MSADPTGSASQQCLPEIPHGLKAVRDDNRGKSLRRPEAGFSLVELLVVLVLLGLMTAVVVPSIGSLDRPAAETPTDEVIQLFADARRAAVETARPVELRVAFASGHYRVTKPEGSASSGTLRAAGTLQVTAGAEVGHWRFEPDGRVAGPALFVTGANARTLRFDPGTGELLP